jgi:hypothetical protein
MRAGLQVTLYENRGWQSLEEAALETLQELRPDLGGRGKVFEAHTLLGPKPRELFSEIRSALSH